MILRFMVECKFCLSQIRSVKVPAARESVALDLLNYMIFFPKQSFPPGFRFSNLRRHFSRTALSATLHLHMLLEQKVQGRLSRSSSSSNVQSMSQLHFALIKRRSNLLITEEKTFSISERSRRTECLLIENGINANISRLELARIIYSRTLILFDQRINLHLQVVRGYY